MNASGSKTSVSSPTPTSAIIYDAYTSLKKNKKNNKKIESLCSFISFLHIFANNF